MHASVAPEFGTNGKMFMHASAELCALESLVAAEGSSAQREGQAEVLESAASELGIVDQRHTLESSCESVLSAKV